MKILISLSAENIDRCAEEVKKYLSSQKIESRDQKRFSLSVEEALLRTMDQQGVGAKVSLNMGIRFLSPTVTLSVEGPAYNALSKKAEDRSALGDSLLRNLGLEPEHSYRDGVNIYSFRAHRQRMNPFVSLALTLVAAFAFGFLGIAVLPDAFRMSILDNILTPIHDTFLNVLGGIAGPMVFLSVAWGIYGIGDAATLKRVGKRLMGGYTGTVFLVAAVMTLLALPLFSLSFSGSKGGHSELGAIFSMVLGIFPKNIIAPFNDGNTLQIIFLAVCVGIAMLFLGQKTTSVARAVEQINYIVQFLIEFISRLVPYFIFIVLVSMIWSDTTSILVGVAKMFLIFIGMVLLMVIILISITSVRCRINPFKLARKGLPTLIIALTTASSAAAFGNNMTACRKEYGIDDTIASFGIPLGMVTFKPTTALNYISVALFFSESYHVEVSASWVIVMVLTATILAIATPPIPGGALTAYTVLFAQMGIPAEALAIALACDTLFDFVDTGCDQFLIPFTLLGQANRLGLVNRDVLLNKKK